MKAEGLLRLDELMQFEIHGMGNADLSRLASSLSAHNFFATKLRFSDELMMRLDTMESRSLSQIFNFVVLCDAAERALVARLFRTLQLRIHEFSVKSLVQILIVLLRKSVVEFQESREIALLIARHVSHLRVDSLDPSDCCSLVEGLVTMSVCPEPLAVQLAGRALQFPGRLTSRDVCNLIATVSTAERSSAKEITQRLLDASPEISASSLKLKHVSLLVKGMEHMSLFHYPWLREIATYAKRNARDMWNRRQGITLVQIAAGLSQLNFPARPLFDVIQAILDEEFDKSAPAFNPHSPIMVRLLWACAVQRCYPSKNLTKLFAMEPNQVSMLFFSLIFRGTTVRSRFEERKILDLGFRLCSYRRISCQTGFHTYYPGQKQIETTWSHDIERTLFDVLDHERRAKRASNGCASGADRS